MPDVSRYKTIQTGKQEHTLSGIKVQYGFEIIAEKNETDRAMY